MGTVLPPGRYLVTFGDIFVTSKGGDYWNPAEMPLHILHRTGHPLTTKNYLLHTRVQYRTTYMCSYSYRRTHMHTRGGDQIAYTVSYPAFYTSG